VSGRAKAKAARPGCRNAVHRHRPDAVRLNEPVQTLRRSAKGCDIANMAAIAAYAAGQ